MESVENKNYQSKKQYIMKYFETEKGKEAKTRARKKYVENNKEKLKQYNKDYYHRKKLEKETEKSNDNF